MDFKFCYKEYVAEHNRGNKICLISLTRTCVKSTVAKRVYLEQPIGHHVVSRPKYHWKNGVAKFLRG